MLKTGSGILMSIIMNKPQQLTFPWHKSNKSSFDEFYVVSSNSQLLSALQDQSSNEDFFISGSQDSGKTYLLQALCNFYNEMDKSSLLIPTNQLIKYGTDILDAVENLDLICIDGLENIISNELWETAIFNLINRSLVSHSRLIFTSSQDLKQMKFILPDLESRLRKLESYELHPIKDEELFDALKYISKLRLINLGDKEANYLIKYSNRSISNLVKILESLDKLSMEMKRKITIPLIKEVI